MSGFSANIRINRDTPTLILDYYVEHSRQQLSLQKLYDIKFLGDGTCLHGRDGRSIIVCFT